MTDLDLAWALSGGSLDAPPEDPYPNAHYLAPGYPYPPRPYGWWRTAEVRALVEEAAQDAAVIVGDDLSRHPGTGRLLAARSLTVSGLDLRSVAAGGLGGRTVVPGLVDGGRDW